jgi:hypothetical protein
MAFGAFLCHTARRGFVVFQSSDHGIGCTIATADLGEFSSGENSVGKTF